MRIRKKWSFGNITGIYVGFIGSYAYNCVCKDCKNNFEHAGFVNISYCYNCVSLNNKGFNDIRNDYFENKFLSRCIGDASEFNESDIVKHCLKLDSIPVDENIFPFSVLNYPPPINQ